MKIILLFTLILMNFSLYFFPFMFGFDDRGGWFMWYIIPVTFTFFLGDVIYKKGCWFFQNN